MPIRTKQTQKHTNHNPNKENQTFSAKRNHQCTGIRIYRGSYVQLRHTLMSRHQWSCMVYTLRVQDTVHSRNSLRKPVKSFCANQSAVCYAGRHVRGGTTELGLSVSICDREASSSLPSTNEERPSSHPPIESALRKPLRVHLVASAERHRPHSRCQSFSGCSSRAGHRTQALYYSLPHTAVRFISLIPFILMHQKNREQSKR